MCLIGPNLPSGVCSKVLWIRTLVNLWCENICHDFSLVSQVVAYQTENYYSSHVVPFLIPVLQIKLKIITVTFMDLVTVKTSLVFTKKYMMSLD
jgi:hypothetical protein